MKQFYLITILFFLSEQVLASSPGCDGRFVTPLETDWANIGDIVIGSAEVYSGNGRSPLLLVKTMLCTCPGTIFPISTGAFVTMHLPSYQMEVSKTPACFPSLDGLKLTSSYDINSGGVLKGVDEYSTTAFYHTAIYPSVMGKLIRLIDGIQIPEINTYISAFDPTATDEAYSLALQPEAYVLANPVTSILSAASGMFSTTLGRTLPPFDWFVRGDGGFNFGKGFSSFKSQVHGRINVARVVINKLHRTGLVYSKIGPHAICGPIPIGFHTGGQTRMEMQFPARLTGLPIEFTDITPIKLISPKKNAKDYFVNATSQLVWEASQICINP